MSTAHRIIKNLINNGNKLLGAGCYSAVFKSKAKPFTVIKVGSTATDPWLYFYEHIVKNNRLNPCVPDVKSLYVDVENNFYIAEMEDLTSPKLTKYQWRLKDHVFTYGRSAGEDTEAGVNILEELDVDFSEHLIQLLDIIIEHTDHFEGANYLNNNYADGERVIDLHDGNIMFRDKTPVIIDPWSDNYVSSERTLDEWIDNLDEEYGGHLYHSIV